MTGTLNETVDNLESNLAKTKWRKISDKILFNTTLVLSKEQAEPTAIQIIEQQTHNFYNNYAF